MNKDYCDNAVMNNYSGELLQKLCLSVIKAVDGEWRFEAFQSNDIRLLYIPDFTKELDRMYIEIETDDMFVCDIRDDSLLVTPKADWDHLMYYANHYHNNEEEANWDPVFLCKRLIQRVTIQNLDEKRRNFAMEECGLLQSYMLVNRYVSRCDDDLRTSLHEKRDQIINKIFKPGTAPKYLEITLDEEDYSYDEKSQFLKEYVENREKYWKDMII